MTAPSVPVQTVRVLGRLVAFGRALPQTIVVTYAEKGLDPDAEYQLRGSLEFPVQMLPDAVSLLQGLVEQLTTADLASVATAPAPAPALPEPIPPDDAELIWALGLPVTDLQPRQKRRRR